MDSDPKFTVVILGITNSLLILRLAASCQGSDLVKFLSKELIDRRLLKVINFRSSLRFALLFCLLSESLVHARSSHSFIDLVLDLVS